MKRCKKWIAALCLAALFLGACGSGDTKVVLTTGLYADEVFRIESKSCRLPEIMVYLTNTQNQYEKVYGEGIWQSSLEGQTLEENVKEIVIAKMAQIKSLNLLAESMDIALSDAEKELAAEAAAHYYASLNETEMELMGVTEDILRNMYEEYALAEKVYRDIIKDINPEISDDEARTITVMHILVKTYTTDGRGERVPYSDNAKEAALRKITEAYTLATDGEHDFESLVAQYSEDNVAVYSFRKGEMEAPFEEAAFELGNGEISGIVEDSYGYHIIKCINTFNREQTDQNKLKIVEERKKEVFGERYDAFVDTLTRRLNEELWQQVGFIRDERVTTDDFFAVYEETFAEWDWEF